MNAPVKLLIVDDHQVFAEGLEAVFRAEPDFEPLAAVTDPGQVVAVVLEQRPDAVIMDVHLGDASGLDLTAQLTAQPEPPAVVVLTAYCDTATAIGAIQAGAMGFVSKEGPAAHIVTAVRAAVLGGTWFPAGLLDVALATARGECSEPAGQLFGQLTDREREVLQLMVSGLDRYGIASRLYRSPDTVKTHIHNIAAKLGTQSATEAVAVALRAGLRPELPPGSGYRRDSGSCQGSGCRRDSGSCQGSGCRQGGSQEACQLSGSGVNSGAVAVEAGTAEGLTNVLPSGPATTAWPSALPCRYLFQGRNHWVQPLSKVPARGLPVIVTGSPGTSIL
jgi:DNA-binding NarL/FixJ family response regulator